MPHQCLHGTLRIIKEPCKAQPVATEMRTFKNAVPLITQGPTGAKCAATLMSLLTWPCKPAVGPAVAGQRFLRSCQSGRAWTCRHTLRPQRASSSAPGGGGGGGGISPRPYNQHDPCFETFAQAQQLFLIRRWAQVRISIQWPALLLHVVSELQQTPKVLGSSLS